MDYFILITLSFLMTSKRPNSAYSLCILLFGILTEKIMSSITLLKSFVIRVILTKYVCLLVLLFNSVYLGFGVGRMKV